MPISTKPKRLFSVVLPAAFVALALGCSGLPTLRFDPPFGRSDWIEFKDSRLIDGPPSALAVTISNRKNVPLWVRMEIDELGGGDDCMNIFKLTPKANFAYVCRQTSLRVGKHYRAQAIVYKDAGNSKIAESINRVVELQRGPDGELALVGRPAD